MNSEVSLLSGLLQFINGCSSSGSALDIARALVDHFDRIPELSIHDMADLCYVSPASLSRFTKNLGYDSYPEFKEACRKSIGIEVDYSFHKLHPASKEDIQPIFDRYKDRVVENIEFINRHLDLDALSRICEFLHDAPMAAFFGLEFATLISQHFQIKMAECNVPVKVGLTYQRQEEIARLLPEGSVVLIASLEGSYFYLQDQVIQILREKNIRIITFCMYPSKRIREVSTEVILASINNIDTEGRISLLYIIELLIMFYYIRYV